MTHLPRLLQQEGQRASQATWPACRVPWRAGGPARPVLQQEGRRASQATWPVHRVPGRVGPSWQHGASLGGQSWGCTQQPAAPQHGQLLCPVSLGEEPAFHSVLPKHLHLLSAPWCVERQKCCICTRETHPWQHTGEKGGKGNEPLKAQ